LQAAQAASGR